METETKKIAIEIVGIIERAIEIKKNRIKELEEIIEIKKRALRDEAIEIIKREESIYTALDRIHSNIYNTRDNLEKELKKVIKVEGGVEIDFSFSDDLIKNIAALLDLEPSILDRIAIAIEPIIRNGWLLKDITIVLAYNVIMFMLPNGRYESVNIQASTPERKEDFIRRKDKENKIKELFEAYNRVLEKIKGL